MQSSNYAKKGGKVVYKRLLTKNVREALFKGKVVVITGARQTGKTTLTLELIKNSKYANNTKIFNCDNPTDREMLNNKDLDFLLQIIGGSKLIFIDEGQKVDTIGQTLKLLVDHCKQTKQIIVTGSSSLHLLDSTQEVLTGRKKVYTLFPLSLEELFPDKDQLAIAKKLEDLLVFGNYPEVVSQASFEDKTSLLKELSASALYKDILEFQLVKNSAVLNNLLKALALQLGSEVSYTELSNLVGIDKKTVEHYIDLLEKNYVIFRLSPYTKNKRREISRAKKVYFYDLGIRNAIINNFNFISNRNDLGALWENFLILERFKYRSYHNIFADHYFWRTYDGSEVDLVEERSGKLFGYEFKWQPKERSQRPPAKWLEYPGSSYNTITSKNFLDFIF